jgi:lipopolysaccharide export system protein LptA
MRRISLVFSIAAIVIVLVVGYTYKLRRENTRHLHLTPTPEIKTGVEGAAFGGWRYTSDDPQTNRPVVRVFAKSFNATKDPSTFELTALALKLYDKDAEHYTYVTSGHALFDTRSGVMKSNGPVHIIIHVPSEMDAADTQKLAKYVQVITSGVTYETKTGKASSDQAATFVFPAGGGKAIGVEYDPNTKILHLKSKIALDWVGNGPPENKMHVEAGDLVYKEAEQKVYLSPWSKMQRQSTTIEAQNSVITLQDGTLHQIDSDHPSGVDDRDDRHVAYSAEKMTAFFNEYGEMVQITGDKNARVVSKQTAAQTVLTGDKANLLFAVVDTPESGGVVKSESDLHLVTADGHAVAESAPLPVPGILPSETRILRSEHIELEMRPGGQEVQEIRTAQQAQLEFKPNRPEQVHRVLDASRLRIIYGENSYVDTFMGWNVATHTDKPASASKAATGKDSKPGGPAPPALTWSDVMTAKFAPGTNQISTIDQQGNFRYQEGVRKATAKKAFLEQTLNRITLTDSAKVIDDSGSATADRIIMNQANGDMDAVGHVLSTHAPDKNEKPGTSMLDASQPMQARADCMQTRESNTQIFYQGNVTMWQGANRISADKIDLDREEQSLHAVGKVVSELVDNKDRSTDADPAGGAANKAKTTPVASDGPIYTTVEAPELLYRDDTRRALYTGGATLTRQGMTITCKKLEAFLTPKTAQNNSDSSLDHAFADGNVMVFKELANNRKRTATSEHGEYFTADEKVVLNGGSPQMVDSIKGITRGRELVYYSGDDHLLVEGANKSPAFTQMKKR